jgi:hypothetical protein
MDSGHHLNAFRVRLGVLAVILFGLFSASHQQPAIGNWVWMGGTNTTSAAGVYGTKGVPRTTNTPGGRTRHATWYLPTKRELWIFGGRLASGSELKKYNCPRLLVGRAALLERDFDRPFFSADFFAISSLFLLFPGSKAHFFGGAILTSLFRYKLNERSLEVSNE